MPTIPRSTAGPAPSGRGAAPFDFGSGAGRAAQGQALDVTGQAAAAFYEAAQSSAVSSGVREVAQKEDDRLLGFDARLSAASAAENPAEAFKEALSEYEREGEEILAEHRGRISGGRYQRLFDERVFHVSRSGRRRASEMAMARGLAHMRVESDTSVKSFVDLAGRANTKDERNFFLDQIDQTFASDVEAGVRKPGNAEKARLAAHREVDLGDIRQGLREDPMGTLTRLLNPKDPLVSGLTERERQVVIDTGVSEVEQSLARDNTAREHARKELERAQKAEVESVLKNADDLLATGDLGRLQVLLEENREILPAKDYKGYLQSVQEGGVLGTQSNRGVYGGLSDQAARGVDVGTEVRDAFRRGDLDQQDRDRILAQVEDRRFGDAEDFLRDSLEVGEKAVDDVFVVQARSADAMRAWVDWKLAHPEAARTDAFAQAHQLIKDAALVDLENIKSAHLQPSYAVKSGKEIDIEATARATQAARERGEINDFEAAEQFSRLERIEVAQERAAVKEAAKAAKAKPTQKTGP